MANYKKGKPRKYGKVYRGGIDGPDCAFCGSNWKYATSTKSANLLLLYETVSCSNG